MPTIANVPALAVGTDNLWTLSGAADKMAAVNTSDADAGTVDSTVTNGQAQSFTPNYNAVIGGGVAGVGAINSVKVFARCRSNNGNTADFLHRIRRGGSVTDGANQALTSISYLDFTSASLARPGGGSYTPADLSSLEFGLNYNGGGGGLTRWTYGYMILDYEPVVGGIACLVGGLFGPLVAVGLHEIPRLIEEIFHRIGVRITDPLMLYRELREGRCARHFLLEGI